MSYLTNPYRYAPVGECKDCTGFDAIDSENGDDTYLRSISTTASSSYTATGLCCAISDSGNGLGLIKLGLYADSGGVPTTRLAYMNATQAVNGNNLNSYELNVPVSISSGTKYWIAMIADTAMYFRSTGLQPSCTMRWKYGIDFTSILPNPFGSTSCSTTGMQFCIFGA